MEMYKEFFNTYKNGGINKEAEETDLLFYLEKL